MTLPNVFPESFSKSLCEFFGAPDRERHQDMLTLVNNLATMRFDGWEKHPDKTGFTRHGVYFTHTAIANCQNINKLHELVRKATPMPEKYSFEALMTTMRNMGWTFSGNTWQKGALTLPGVLSYILEAFGEQALIQFVTDFENRQIRKDENRPLPETAYATRNTHSESPVYPKTHFIIDPADDAYALAHDEADVERIANLWAEGETGDDSEYLIGQITKRVTTRTTREINIEPIQETP